MADEPQSPTDDSPEGSPEDLPSTGLEAVPFQALPQGSVDEDVARLTSADADLGPAETTDPSLFSVQADTRLDVNLWQLKIVVAIAVPFGIFLRVGEGWKGVAGGIVVGLVLGTLVTGAMLAVRYKRGR